MTQGQRIKMIRKNLNLNLYSFSRLINIDEFTMAKIEKDECQATDASDYAGVQSALLLQKPLYKHRCTSQAACDFTDLADEILERLEVL